MVTRCPILVQMTCPPGVMEHSAIISTQRRDETDEVPADTIPGRFRKQTLPTEQELRSWGKEIQFRITSLQDRIVQPKQVTDQKIIVKLQGPCLPKLSLVDLPGLRAVDDRDSQGLKNKLKQMVTEQLQPESAIILCVGQAGTDPATWVGRELAQQVDSRERRT